MKATINRYTFLTIGALCLLGVNVAHSASPERIGAAQNWLNKSRAAYLFSFQGAVNEGTVISESLGSSYLSCNWGAGVNDVAPISTGPTNVKFSLIDKNGIALKQINIGLEYQVASAHAADVDGNGACDLVVFASSGACTRYLNPASDGSATSCGTLEAKKNYGLARTTNGVVGYFAAGGNGTAPGATLAVYDLAGAQLSRVNLAKVPANIFSLNHDASPRFALIYGSNFEIVDSNGTVVGSGSKPGGGYTATYDALGKSYLQIVTISGDYFDKIAVYDPVVGSGLNQFLGLYISAPPDPNPTPTPTPVPLERCAELQAQAETLYNNGQIAEAQAIVMQMIDLGCFNSEGPPADPAPTGLLAYGPPYLYGATFISSTLMIRDNTGNGEGPCARFYPVKDGYKRGLTVKNSDTRSGQIAALTPGSWFTTKLMLLDPKTYKKKVTYKDNGYAFPDAKGPRHLFRGKGTTRTIAGNILATEMTTGEIRCWKLPKRPDAQARFD